MTDSLDIALGGPTKDVKVGKKTITLAPMRMKQISAFAKAIQPIKAQIGLVAGDMSFENVAELMAAGDDLFKATEIATGVAVKDLEALDLAEFVTLASAAITVNADFFVQKVAPALQGTMTGST